VGRSSCQGPTEEVRRCALSPQACINRRYWQAGGIDETIRTKSFAKACVRAKVEYANGVAKRVFDSQLVRYRGLAGIRHRLEVTTSLASLCMVRRRLLRMQG